jgi:hypothetical protein
MIIDLPNRTKILKTANNLRDHIAHERDFGVREEWDYCRTEGEEFADAVWYTLTTPQRDYIRKVQNDFRAGIYGSRSSA